MPRVTRRSLAAKEEAPSSTAEESSRSTSRGRRANAKKEEPKPEESPVGEPQGQTTKRGGRQQSKETKAPEPKGKTPARGGRASSVRGQKVKEEEEEQEKAATTEQEEEEEPEEQPQGRGSRGRGKGKAAVTPVSTSGRGSRGRAAAKQEEEPAEVQEEVEEPSPSSSTSSRSRRGRQEKQEIEKVEVAASSRRSGSRGGRKSDKQDDQAQDESTEVEAAEKGRGARSRGRAKVEASPSPRAKVEASPSPRAKVEASPSPRAKVEASLSPRAKVEASPSPRAKVEASPSPRAGRSKRGSKAAEVKDEDDGEKDLEQEASEGREKDLEQEASEGQEKEAPISKETIPEETHVDPQAEEESSQSEEKEIISKPSENKSSIADQSESEHVAEASISKVEEKPGDTEEAMETEEVKEAPVVVPEVPSTATPTKKRKLEEEQEEEEESQPKKAKTEDTEEVELSDFVVVNKDDVPAPDSKEVQESTPTVPPPPTTDSVVMDTNSTETVERIIPPAEVQVPLTEAELTKQYTKVHMDRDETSSTLVEVGSEGVGDVTGMSVRSLDTSDAVSVDSTSIAASAMDEISNTSSSVSTPSVLSTTLPQTEVKTPNFPPALPSSVSVQPTQSNNSLPSQQQQQPSSVTGTAQENSEPHRENVDREQQPSVEQSNSAASPPTQNDTDNPQAPTEASTATTEISQPTQNHTAPQNGSGVDSNGVETFPNEEKAIQNPPPPPQSAPTISPVKAPVVSGEVIPPGKMPSSTAIDCRKFVLNPSFPMELMDPASWFSVVSYNILAECHWKRSDYSYTAPEHMALPYRHALTLKELDYLDGDIVCLQEVEPRYYQDTLLPAMSSRGYSGWFVKRTKDYYDEGEATFVKNSRFTVKSSEGISLKDLAYKEVDDSGLSPEVAAAAKTYLDRADVIMLTQLQCNKTGKTVTVANIHVVYDITAPDVQCIQVACSIKQLVSKAGSDLNPHIICGDFNSPVTSAGYQLAKDGYLTDDHIARLQAVESLSNTDGASRSLIHHLWKAFQHTSSNLKSAYEVAMGKEPGVTTYTVNQHSCLDYIFFSSDSLDNVGVTEVIDQAVVDATRGLPTAHIPSDHLSVKGVFRLK